MEAKGLETLLDVLIDMTKVLLLKFYCFQKHLWTLMRLANYCYNSGIVEMLLLNLIQRSSVKDFSNFQWTEATLFRQKKKKLEWAIFP